MTARVSNKSLWMTWLALLLLLGLTWGTAQVDLGLANTVIALAISGVKMMLVLLFFMQVRYSSKLIWIFAGAGFVWLMIMILFTLSDYLTRDKVQPYQKENLPSIIHRIGDSSSP
jgi:cytochrome c oxidase subunit IV